MKSLCRILGGQKYRKVYGHISKVIMIELQYTWPAYGTVNQSMVSLNGTSYVVLVQSVNSRHVLIDTILVAHF